MLAIRYTPLPWRWKQAIIWLAEPKVVAVCVGVIPDAAGRVLILRARYSGHWLLPGGDLHVGEQPHAGLLRECREELGLAVIVERLCGVYADGRSRQLFFSFRCAPLTNRPRLSEEHDRLRYAAPDDAPPPLARIAREALASAAGEPVRMVAL